MKRQILKEINGQRILVFVYILVLLIGTISSFNRPKGYVDVFAMPASGKTIIIDAGHGGWGSGIYS